MSQPAKEEIQNLLAQLPKPRRSRLFALFVKIGTGYAAIAVFTAAALLYLAFNLYLMNEAAHGIAGRLPLVEAVVGMRNALFAQESYAGKYAIFGDPAFIGLYRQRRGELMANLETAERAKPVPGIPGIRRLHAEFEAEAARLFAGKSRDREKLHASVLRLAEALDRIYQEQKGALRADLRRADEQRRITVRWAILISCAGFLLAVFIVPHCIYRVFRSLEKLQAEAHRVACGDFNYRPQAKVPGEISELAGDVDRMAARIIETERDNVEALPLTRLPGTAAIERVLNERLKSGTPFCCCHLELLALRSFVARYGYAKAGELLYETGILVHETVRGRGDTEDFAGHAGGDTFVMLVAPERAEAVCGAIEKRFDAEVMARVTGRGLKAGNGPAGDAGPGDRTPPRTAVSIAVLRCDADRYASATEVAGAVMELMHRDVGAQERPENGPAGREGGVP